MKKITARAPGKKPRMRTHSQKGALARPGALRAKRTDASASPCSRRRAACRDAGLGVPRVGGLHVRLRLPKLAPVVAHGVVVLGRLRGANRGGHGAFEGTNADSGAVVGFSRVVRSAHGKGAAQCAQARKAAVHARCQQPQTQRQWFAGVLDLRAV